MRRPPTAGRRDGNENAIVQAARKMGLKVFYTSEWGDLIVQIAGVTELWECKNGKTAKFTEAQCRMRQAGLQARTVRSIDDVMLARAQMMQAASAIQRARIL